MGRSRLTLKHISNDAIRKSTFMKRSDGLMKKVFEYCTLGDIAEACLIVFDNDDDVNGDHQPMMTWPEDLTKIHSIIQKYENQKNEEEEPSTMFGIQEYFEIKKNLVEADISKVRKEILKVKYPTWDQRFNNLEDEPLLNFIGVLDEKIAACIQRKKLLKIQNELEVILAQTNNAASNSNQASLMQNNFQSQLIPIPMDNQVDSSFDLSQQVNFADNVDVALDSTKQSDAAEPDWDSLHELLDCASQGGFSEDRTSDLHELMSCNRQPSNFVYINDFS
ncbi:hypothetical protein Lal_00010922 [Lupinus albus]|nr:hypothetical protein Lal_00010922 [Lupinus albus]